MKVAFSKPVGDVCKICGEKGAITEVDTYKSTWFFCGKCKCYSRAQKIKYPLEDLSSIFLKLFKKIPKINGFFSSLSRKKQGVDFYRYYSEQLETGLRGPWEGQTRMVEEELHDAGLLDEWKGKKVLEISGEPGFFAQDLKNEGADVFVSAFAGDVAEAMHTHLGVKTFVYDFNNDDIYKNINSKDKKNSYDFIFIRYSIGFCENVPRLFHDLSNLLKQNGLLYVSFNPASRAVLLRWMFDDYTYLRQYTESHLNESATHAGLRLHARFDEGFFYWDHGPYSMHWSLRPFARRYLTKDSFYSKGSVDDSVQKRVALMYIKKDG